MFPSEKQLLKQLHRSAQSLMSTLTSRDQISQVAAMDAIVNELLLRQDRAFYQTYYVTGFELVREAQALVGDRFSADLKSRIGQCPPELSSTLADNDTREQLLVLSDILQTIVDAIGADDGGDARPLLNRIVEWDVRLLAYRLNQVPVGEAVGTGSMEIDQDALCRYLAKRQPGWRNLEVTDFFKVPGGFSKCTILFDTTDKVNGVQQFAIRAEQPTQLLALEGSDITNEFPVVSKAFESGIPVAEPLWLETDTGPFKTRFFVSRKAEGANFGTATGASSELSQAAVKSLAEVLAGIHAIDMDRQADWVNQCHFGRWLDFGHCRGNTGSRIVEWRKQARDAQLYPAPQIARALNWLEANVPAYDGPTVFLHGDYGPHNILLDGDRVSAVLDWEIATAGDAAYDVCWFLNCTAGAVKPEQFLELYYAAGGQPISEYRLRYFEVFACMFMPITANAALRLVEEEDGANINLAYYGMQFGHEYASRLLAAIDRAEAVKDRQ